MQTPSQGRPRVVFEQASRITSHVLRQSHDAARMMLAKDRQSSDEGDFVIDCPSS